MYTTKIVTLNQFTSHHDYQVGRLAAVIVSLSEAQDEDDIRYLEYLAVLASDEMLDEWITEALVQAGVNLLLNL